MDSMVLAPEDSAGAARIAAIALNSGTAPLSNARFSDDIKSVAIRDSQASVIATQKSNSANGLDVAGQTAVELGVVARDCALAEFAPDVSFVESRGRDTDLHRSRSTVVATLALRSKLDIDTLLLLPTVPSTKDQVASDAPLAHEGQQQHHMKKPAMPEVVGGELQPISWRSRMAKLIAAAIWAP